jgi:hypothetical protein
MCNKLIKPIISNRTLKVLALMNLCFLIYLPTTANAYSTVFDFGPVAVGTTRSTAVTIANQENDAVAVTGISFLPDGCSDFSIISRPELMLIPAGEALEIGVNFSPSAVGDCQNVLRIWTDSPIPHTVAFSGTGVVTRKLLEDKIQEILAYVDIHMTGEGAGNSAENRLNALHHMIEAAAVQIKNDQPGAAWHKLSEIYKKADGFSQPTDFVNEGMTNRLYSTNTLSGLIKDLMTLLASGAIQTEKPAGSRATP